MLDWSSTRHHSGRSVIHISSFLILHGLANHRPPAHWQFWLAARLAAEGHFVLYPALPDPDAPSLVAWQDDLHRYLGTMGGGDHTVICHSLACLLWFRSADSVTEELRPDRLLLVAPPGSDQVPDSGAEFRLRDLDSAAVRSSVGGELRIVASDDDPYNVSRSSGQLRRPAGCRRRDRLGRRSHNPRRRIRALAGGGIVVSFRQGESMISVAAAMGSLRSHRNPSRPAPGRSGLVTNTINEEARVWISGFDAVNRKLGIKTVSDHSATPFFLRGTGYSEGTLFPSVVSEFWLIDAIESGVAKVPASRWPGGSEGEVSFSAFAVRL